ncbi:TPA: hypothetical protein N0F65_005824 [Lagenidium giganteum]|uniref:Spondin-like TSP1 domain-containing protein n=1 Tax=Lagenidium giganteum TaxID=4803 RepID=A0AAV2YRB6_9STRA|nr:TPA: hypothetical protein N0F65_005824 [Lagenidium giganteum]
MPTSRVALVVDLMAIKDARAADLHGIRRSSSLSATRKARSQVQATQQAIQRQRSLAALVATAALAAASVDAAWSFRQGVYGNIDVDCVVGNWVYGPCDAYSFQVRRRAVTTQPSGRGKACPTLEEKVACKPIPCVVSAWGPFSACDDSGWKTHTRTITTEPKNGGTPCPPLAEKVQCQKVDCQVCHWTDWLCDAKTKMKTRTRPITVQPQDGGAPCPPLKETLPCDPIDCKLSDWSQWSDCAPDEKAVWWRKHTRVVVTPDKFDGKKCDVLEERELCASVDCKMGEWTQWSACAPDDKDVYWKTQSRSIISPPKFGGLECGPQTNRQKCEVNNCVVSGWSDWSACFKDDSGKWVQKHTRNIVTPAQYGGAACPELEARQPCQPVNCATSSWSDWGACFQDEQGKWVQKHTRSIITPAAYDGTPCGPLEERQACVPRDCVASAWSAWSECQPDADGVWWRTATRSVVTSELYGGAGCGDLTKREKCEPVNCALSSWSDWSDCAKTSDQWTSKRTRTITVQPQYGGTKCDKLEDQQVCKAVDCAVSGWSDWTDCKPDDKNGWWHRKSRTILTPPLYDGKPCADLEVVEKCDSKDCKPTDWSDWSACFQDGDKWYQKQTRTVATPAQNGGKECGPMEQRQPCVPVDCVPSDWSSWSDCAPGADGEWWQTQTRTVKTPALYGGKDCAPLSQRQVCKAVDCVTSAWADWGACTEGEDHVWRQSHTRTITVQPMYGGLKCPSLEEKQVCPPVDCQESAWSGWSACAADASGVWWKTQSRSVVTQPMYGGRKCCELTQRELCPPVHCDTSDWSDWSECFKDESSKWVKKHTRTVTIQPMYGGKACPTLEERQGCAPRDCVASAWSAWSECKPDDAGVWWRTATRTVVTPQLYDGAGCGDLTKREKCEPVNCALSTWSEWSDCAKTGDQWTRKHTRTITVQPQYGGTACDKLEETEVCKPVNCALSGWSDWTECKPDDQNVWWHSKSRTILTAPLYDGKACDELDHREKCDSKDCKPTQWSDWSACFQDGSGKWFQKQTRAVDTPAQYGGKTCEPLEQRQPCVPVDCVETEWSQWSECVRADCGTWWKTQTRAVKTPALYGGKECGAMSQREVCAPVDCSMSDWSAWGECKEVEPRRWRRSHTRTITVQPMYGGRECPSLEQSEACAKVDCVVSDWSEWSVCQRGEDEYRGHFGQQIAHETWWQTQTRTITTQPMYGGDKCPDLTQRKLCKPVECEVTEWSTWSECYLDNSGKWVKKQTRTILTQPAYGGRMCPKLEKFEACSTQACVVSDWSAWTPCTSDSKGVWWRSHSRSVIQTPKCGGAACPVLEEKDVCAPRDCQLSDWTAWSDCMQDDQGKWYKKQTRTVIAAPLYGGQACGALEQRLDCPAKDCTVSDWSPWVCNANGRQTRTRTIVTPAKYGGTCPALSEEAACPPVPCKLGDWTDWSPCNQDTGKRTRTRPVLQQPLWGAPECDITEDKKDCEPELCVMCDWSQWGPCNKDGIQKRTRKIDKPARWNGAECGPTEEVRQCAPEDCVVSDWSAWSACDHTCGHKTRIRHVLHSPRFNGRECPWLEEKANCDPVPCKMGEWSDWSGCNCKTGLRTRKRRVLEYPRYGGKSCPVQEENQKCNPVDCHLSDWGEWSGCNAATMLQTRTRTVLTYPQDGGLACGKTTETRKCQQVDCKLSDWSDWSVCDTSTGLKSRWREVTQFAENGGTECTGKLSETVPCDAVPCKLADEYLPWGRCCQSTCMQRAERKILEHARNGGTACSAIPGFVKEQRCFEVQAEWSFRHGVLVTPPKVDCVVSAWVYTNCDSYGFQTRRRTVTTQPSGGGLACPILEEKVRCVPVDCVVSDWGPFGDCDATGWKMHTRKVVTPAANGGKSCPPLAEKVLCEKIDCEVCQWTDWLCDAGTKQKTRTRPIIVQPQDGGAPCPPLKETAPCDPIDCKLSDWGPCSACAPDDKGVWWKKRTRTVITEPKYDGKTCDSLELVEKCPPVDCKMSDFGDWSACAPDDKGVWWKTQTRTVLSPAQFGGQACGPLVNKQQCQSVNCEVSTWSGWSACFKDDAGKWVQKHTRTVTVQPMYGGNQCPVLEERQSCPPVNCVTSGWSDWSTCFQDDKGKWVQKHTRTIITPDAYDGTPCGALEERQACTPRDCVASAWSAWGECKPDADGVWWRTSTRTVVTPELYGGAGCGDLSKREKCQPVDCALSPYGAWSDCVKTGSQWTRKHSRSIVVQPLYGGKPCDGLEEQQVCPPVDCALSGWSDWTDCKPDASNVWWHSKSRTILTPPLYDGKPCDDLQKVEKCDAKDCKATDWSAWSACFQDGYKWYQKQTRTVATPAQFGGKECGPMEQRQPCIPVDCVPSDWSAWSDCVADADGVWWQTQTRTVKTPALYGGKDCSPLSQRQVCKAVDCVTSGWSDYGACTEGDDHVWRQSHTRTVTVQPKYGGLKCPALEEKKVCPPVDCQESAWSGWSACAPDDKGVWWKTQSRSVVTQPMYGGRKCCELTQRELCAPVHCDTSSWSDWSACFQDDSGKWVKKHTRTVTIQPMYGGKLCPVLEERQSCPPVDCRTSAWSDWSECKADADGSWWKTSTRSVITQPLYGGVACGDLTKRDKCVPVDCAVSAWSAWSTCSKVGDVWQRKHTRTVTVQPMYGGKQCDALEETEQCKPVDCVLSAWSDWTECKADANNVWWHTKSRSILMAPLYDGKACDVLEQREKCDAMDCKPTDFSPWSECIAGGSGKWYQKQTRAVVTPAQYGGKTCEPLEQRQPCVPVDCVATEWSAWSACAPDAYGVWWKTQTRSVKTPALYGGKECGSLTQRELCPPVDCVMSDWAAWGECKEVEPRKWRRSHSRTVTTQPMYGGKACPPLDESEACPRVDCVVSDWSQWSVCTRGEDEYCGQFGQKIARETWWQTQTRTITKQPMYGGDKCPDLTQRKLCAPVDCTVSLWSGWSECYQDTNGKWVKKQTRTIATQPMYGGAACPNLEQYESCPPAPCTVSEWSAWTECAPDANGVWWRSHSRTVLQQAKCGGTACPPLTEKEICPARRCETSDWSAWSDCMQDDKGKWYKKQTRTVTVTPQYGGEACGLLEQRLDCPAKDCTLTDWTPWVCNANGRQTRTRTIVTPAKYGGTCPALSEEAACPPVPCKLGDWTDWSPCNQDTGKRTRTRPVLQQPLWGAPACDITEDKKDCDPEPCTTCDWSQWGPCDKNGIQKRTRKIDRPARWKGAECGPLEQTQQCQPIDCVMGDWSDWSPCDNSCGFKTRRRSIIQAGLFGGRQCPAQEEKANCDPVACRVSDWSDWSGCNCKSGLRTRKRIVLEYSRYGGQGCPELEENQKCNPVDCHLGEWGDWSACNPLTKLQTRVRSVLTYPQDGGAECEPTSETRSCGKIDCKLGGWTDWSACDDSTGLKTRWRIVQQYPDLEGAKCDGPLSETATCDPVPCKLADDYLPWGVCCQSSCMQRAERKVISHAKYGGTDTFRMAGYDIDCAVSDWSYGACDAYGNQVRKRTIVKAPMGAGKACPALQETVKCSKAVDCVVSDWSAYAKCDAYGKQTRTRTVVTPASNGGKACPPLTETTPCAVDCVVSAWSAYGKCDSYGKQTRTRTVTTPASNGGKACPSLTDSKSCDIDCVVSAWGDWVTNEKTGMKTRTRTVQVYAKGSGKACPNLTETTKCEPVDCVPGDWGAWSECDSYGAKKRTRLVKTPAQYGGKECKPEVEVGTCPKVACVVTAWGDWSTCAPDGSGKYYRTRARKVTQKSQYGGDACPGDLVQREECPPFDCQLSPWSSPSECTKDAYGKWTQPQTRTIVSAARCGGKECEAVTRTLPCTPVDCVTTCWSDWSTCTKDAYGKWSQTRTRSIKAQPLFGGQDCPALEERQSCAPVDCQASAYSTWSDCTPDNYGTWWKTQTKSVITAAAYGGKECDTLVNKVKCDPVDCITTCWSDWSTCTQDAYGKWSQTRTRSVKAQPQYGGKVCPSLSESQSCVPVDCVVSGWSDWSDCAADNYGVWWKTATRTITVAPQYGGKECPALVDRQKCDSGDCQCGEWSDWSACYQDKYGKWVQKQTRIVKTSAKYGGKECPALEQTQACPPQDCDQSDWSEWSECAPDNNGVWWKTATRVTKSTALYGGQACGECTRKEKCVPVDCSVTDWCEWSTCFQDDYGKWVQKRTRTVKSPAKYGGKDVQTLEQRQPCAPRDCVQSDWSAWSDCVADDYGVWWKTHTRTTLVEPQYGGKPCDVATQREKCCPVDCAVSGWCGGDVCAPDESGVWWRTQTRKITTNPLYGGKACGDLTHKELCPPKDCTMSAWSDWTECAPDNYGVWWKTQSRSVVAQPQYGGKACGDLVNREKCCVTDCAVSAWSEWSTCAPDNYGVWWRTQTRTVLTPAKNGGAACPVLTNREKCTPKNCEVSCWSDWSTCTQDAYGKWSRKRTRTVTSPASNGGAECPVLTDSEACAPVDCAVCGWSDWSDCVADNYGVWWKTATRTVTVQPQYGGKECPALVDRQKCVNDDCVVSDWSAWSECYQDNYGKWVQKQTRTIKTQPKYGGKQCPALEQTQVCQPKDCDQSDWSDWSECAPDNYGVWWRTQTRVTKSNPLYGGKTCGDCTRKEKCVPVDCVVSDWCSWSTCYQDDYGKWVQKHTRTITTPPKYGGNECPALLETQPCPPVDCVLTDWCSWSDCAADDYGVWWKTRKRTVTTQPMYGGKACDVLTQREKCCSTDCVMSDWSDYSACAPDDYGVWWKTQTRTITTQPSYGGRACGELIHKEKCAKVDCKVSNWCDWSECKADAYGKWSRKHTRTIITQPQNGGMACPALEESEACPPVDCKQSCWSDWSACFMTDYGKWIKTQTRTVITPAQYGGKACAEEKATLDCTPIDCVLSDWSDWVCCKDTGVQKRSRSVISEALFGGKCGNLVEEKPCTPVDCTVGDWGDWSTCNEYTGKRTRTRSVVQAALYKGKECPALTEEKSCEPQHCCTTDWSQWSKCDANGISKRTRAIDLPAKYGGDSCPPLEETRKCEPCHCVVSDWSAWSACDHSCGHKTRTRRIISSPLYGGDACPPLEEKANCDPIPCKVTEWSAWSGCNCKSGLRTRKRQVIEFARYGGAACPKLAESEECSPVDCHVGDWTTWGACDPSTKMQSRTRPILTFPQDGGAACPATTQTRKCAPVDCKLSDWSDWSKCDLGTGLKTRTRSMVSSADYGGKACDGKLRETAPCDPLDCQLSDDYMPWGVCCQATCTHRAERKILAHAQYGGKECSETPGFAKVEQCFEGRCSVYAVK